MKLKLLIPTLFYFCSFTMIAQEEIETDRPDKTENSALVPKNMFQFEAGISHEQNSKNEVEFQLPTVLSKYGFNERIELRLIASFAYSSEYKSEQYGLKELQAGAKIKILDEQYGFANLSLIAQLQIPKVESSNFTTQHLAPELRAALRNTLSQDIDLGYNVGLKWDGTSGQPQYFYTIAPNFKISKNLQAFVENYGYFPISSHAEEWIDGGLALHINPNVQLDFAMGVELSRTENYHHFFEAVGLSFRI
jgi:hypothetical protein